nr:putative transcription factor Ovo-like 1 [Megalopta genalis]
MKWECGGKRVAEEAVAAGRWTARRKLRHDAPHRREPRHEDQLLKCLQCGRGYKMKHSLIKHLRYECGGRKNFACDLCESRYTQNVNLRRHLMKIHNVYRPPLVNTGRKSL